jgi:cytochrome c biogenesis protein CcmG/thiol:disulfide interchange protein DsbE
MTQDPVRPGRNLGRPLLIVAGIALIAIVGIVAFVPLGGGPSATPAPGTSPGSSPIVIGGSPLLDKPAPPIALETLDGEPVTLADFAGRPVVLNFWASWCVPCRAEFPVLVAAREEYAADGLEILGIVYKDSAENAQRFADDHGAEWPLLADPGEQAYNDYLGFGVPYSVFIDGEGIVRAVSFGEVSEDGFRMQMEQVLPEG